jgi:hypothetical protein
MSLSGRVQTEPVSHADRAPVTISVFGAVCDGATAPSDRNHPAPVPRASVTDVLTSSRVGFWPMTRTDGLESDRPPLVIATVAVDAPATEMFTVAAATNNSGRQRQTNARHRRGGENFTGVEG